MANLSTVIVPAKALKGGRHKIRIALSHNGETRYIVTDIIIDSDKEFKNGVIVRRPDAAILNTKIRGLLLKYQEIIDKAYYINGLTCSELIAFLKDAKEIKSSSLRAIHDEYMVNSTAKPQSLHYYETCWKGITLHIDENMPIANLKYSTILFLEKSLRKRKLSNSSIYNYMSFLRALTNYAKITGYADFRIDPFAGYKMPPTEVRDCWLSFDEIRLIRDVELKKKNLNKFRDIFMLSYYLGGINVADLTKINFNDNNKNIKYVREKTKDRIKNNKYVEFRMPEEARSIIAKYKLDDGYIFLNGKNSRNFFWYNARQLSELLNIPNLVFYSARKSFSQHAFILGVNTTVIDYILGHKVDKQNRTLYSYIKVTPEMATNAIRTVLDYIK